MDYDKQLYHGLYHTYDIIYDIDYDLHYKILGQTYDLAVCIIVVVSPKLTYDIIVHIENMICLGKKVKQHTLKGGCTDSNPGPSDRRTNAFPTKPAASPDALSCDESIRPYWDIYTRQIRLASKGGQGPLKYKVQDITGMILTMIS